MNRHLTATLAFAIALSSTSLQAQNRTGTGAVSELYAANCATCHGKNMEGGAALSLLDNLWLQGGSDEALASSIREGIPETEMISWKDRLSDEQIRSLVIYIREKRHAEDRNVVLKRSTPEDETFRSDHYTFELEKIAETDGVFWGMDFLPDGAILATRRDGQLSLIREGETMDLIKGIPEVWDLGQGGLLDVGIHPDYARNGWIYLAYTESTGTWLEGKRRLSMTAVVRGRIHDGRWGDQETIFHVPSELHLPSQVHFGSRFVFKDGYLFFSIGDRGRKEMAQDPGRPNGKIHRVHDDGRIPVDNPYFGNEGAIETVWTYGHRNPQGLALHPQTGELWSSEHGPRGGDEINWIRRGRNYGWPVITHGMNYDGTAITKNTSQAGMEQPVYHWTPSIAVSGIAFYEGNVFPLWDGNLFVCGLASESFHRLELDGRSVIEDEIILENQGRVRDVALGPNGYLYIMLNKRSPDTATIYRLVPADS